jgi:excisionase family DNA binding protein
MKSVKNTKSVSSEKDNPEVLFTSHQVGELLQVNPSSVNNWVNDGKIPAFRTPGGHRRIRRSDLLAFLREHHMPIPPSLLGGGDRRRILVVDDEPAQLNIFKRLLKPYAEVVELAVAKNGVDALVIVGAFKPHLILLDIFMPGIDGLEVCRRLQVLPETSGITIVVTSGRLTKELERQALSAGASRCLEKPVDVRRLLEEAGVETARLFTQ